MNLVKSLKTTLLFPRIYTKIFKSIHRRGPFQQATWMETPEGIRSDLTDVVIPVCRSSVLIWVIRRNLNCDIIKGSILLSL